MSDETFGTNTRDQITLKISIDGNTPDAARLKKAFRFSVDSTVHEVLVDIRNKTHGTATGDYKFGLFLPPNRETGAKGFWLQENRKIRFYGFSMETEVEYKSKERPLKVKLIDERILTVKIDDSLTSREICNIVAEKLNIKSSDEFSLCKPTPDGLIKARPWLSDDMTLHEQDVNPDDVLEFAKRYFFNDDFVDPDDPYTLHLLFVGANKAIIGGTYPVKVDEAIELAGYAVQITYGNHNPKVHIPGFLDPMMFVPKNHRKDWKKIEKLILKEHEKYFTMKETTAKFRYIQKVRALDTYGITFFECQECVEKNKRQKWKPVLIGVTKDKIMKVDNETQELQGEWTWTQVARWSSKGETFLFDFGDYAKEYLTIRSAETEALNSLVTGYIELILKNLQDVAADGREDSDEIAEIEEITGDFDFAQAGATATYNHPYFEGGLGHMLWDPSRFGNIDPGQRGPWADQSSPAMMTNANDMGSALKASRMLSDELGTQKGKWGNKGAVKESDWQKHFDASNSAMATRMEDIINTVSIGAGGKLNRQQLDMKSQDLVVQMMNMTTAARALTAFNEDRSGLLDGAKAVADCVADLMQLLNSTCDDPLGAEALKEALQACKQMFENSQLLLNDPSLINYVDHGAELLMLKCVEDVDRSLEGLTNIVQRGIEDLPRTQQNVLMIDVNKVNAVRGIAVSSLNQLIPFSLNPTIVERIVLSSKTLQVLATSTLNSAIAMVPSTYANSLEAGAKRVTDALQNLMLAARTAETKSTADIDMSTPLKKVLLETVTIKNNIEDDQIVQGSFSEIRAQEIPIQKTFVALKKISTKPVQNTLDTTYADMVSAQKHMMESKQLSNPIVENYVSTINALDKAAQSSTALNNLRAATKILLASIMGLGTDIHLIAPNIDDQNQVNILIDLSSNTQTGVSKIINALKNSATDPQNIAKALELVSLVKTQLPIQSQLSTEAKRTARDIADLNERQRLDMSAGEVQKNLQEVVAAAKVVSDIAGLTEVDKVMGGFDLIKAQLEQLRSEIEAGQLVPVPRQSKENAVAMLRAGLQSIQLSLAEMTAVTKGAAGLVVPIRASLSGLSQSVASILPLVASTEDRAQQDSLDALANALYNATNDVASASKFSQIEKDNPKRTEARDASIQNCKKEIAKLLAEAENMNDQEYKNILDQLEKAKKALNKNEYVQTTSHANAFAALPIAAKPVKAGVMQLSTALQFDPLAAPRYSSVLADNTITLLQLSSVAASAIPDVTASNNLLDLAKALADAVSTTIVEAQKCEKSPTPANLQKLAEAEAQVDTCLQRLTLSGTGKTSEDSKKAIEKIANLLGNLNAIEAEAASTADVRQEFISTTKDVANLLGALVSTARSSNSIDNGLVAKEAAGAIYHVLVAAQSAKKSDGTRKPLSLDAVRICKGTNEIINSPDDPKASLQAAKKTTLHCANLVAQAKQIAKQEKDHETRSKLIAATQALIDSTTELGEASKVAANKRTPLSIQQLSKVAGEVKANTKTLDELIRNCKGIQPEAVNSQAADELVDIACEIAKSIATIIARSAEVAANANDDVASVNLVKATNVTNEQFTQAMKICAKLNPGLMACERTIESIKQLARSLVDAQALSKVGKLPATSADIKLTIQSCQDLIAANKVLAASAQGTAAQLEQASIQVDNAIKQFASRIVGVAGSINDNYAQQQLLATAKGFTDSQIELLQAIPATSSDNPKSLLLLNQAVTGTTNELQLLISQLNVETGFDGMDSSVDTITASLKDFQNLSAELSTQDYDLAYLDLLSAAQDLASALGGLVNSDKKNQTAVMNGVSQLTAAMPKLVTATKNLSASAPQSLKQQLHSDLKTIGDGSVGLIGSINSICRGNDETEKLKNQYEDISKTLVHMLTVAKEGAIGDQLLTKAINDLKTVSNEVNKGQMYSEAHIMPVDKNVTIGELQKTAFKQLKGIKATVNEFPQVVNQSNAELLGQTATTLASLEKDSIEPLLKAIARITDQQAQAAALVSLKKLVEDSRELVEQSRDAVRGNYKAKERVAVLVPQIQNDIAKFIDDIKSSSSQLVKGEKELDAFKKAIRDLIQNSNGNDSALPKDVIESAREVFQITSDLVFADNIDDAIASGKESVDAIGNLLNNCRGVSSLSHDEKVGEGLIDSSQFVAKAMIKMLEVSKYDKQDPETKGKLEEAASTITTGIDEVVRILRMIPGAASLSLHGADLNFIAQESLNETLKIVKEQGLDLQSSKKLTRTKKGSAELDQTDINNALFDAGYAIAAATSAVVGVGAQIQKNRTTALADLTKKSVKTDPTALSALIGSSKETAGAITNLAKATKASSYKLDEKQLVASANAVNTATSHMVAALKAGATEQEAETVSKLISYNAAVVEATSALMSAVHRASSFNEVVEVEAPDTGKVKELEIQIRILKLEKAIKREQRKLDAMKLAQKQNS